MAFDEKMQEKVLLENGTYRLKVTKIGSFTKDFGKGQISESWIFNFDILSPSNYAGKICPPLFVQKGLKPGNKLDRILRAITKKVFQPGEKLTEDMIIGACVDALIVKAEDKKKPGEYNNRIQELYPVTDTQAHITTPPVITATATTGRVLDI
jgi:hypothetical protein